MTNRRESCRRARDGAARCACRSGFTLVEMAIVVLIIGILVAIAVVKLIDASGDANESSTRQTLAVVRNAIERYRARNGVYPGPTGTEAEFRSNLAPYLNGPFPQCQVGNLNNGVRVQSSGTPLTASGSQGWAYDNATGQFIVNHSQYESY
ncbi:MAG: type II secretion system protein [Planctomycetaceae bacterium]